MGCMSPLEAVVFDLKLLGLHTPWGFPTFLTLSKARTCFIVSRFLCKILSSFEISFWIKVWLLPPWFTWLAWDCWFFKVSSSCMKHSRSLTLTLPLSHINTLAFGLRSEISFMSLVD